LYQWTRDGEAGASLRVHVGNDQVTLSYRHRSDGEEWNDQRYFVRLTWTACNFGGRRPWFRCPKAGCGRRVAILYMGGRVFACRHCYRLAYQSQRENQVDRAARRADRIRETLGWPPGVYNGKGRKPRGMHWRTYVRLTAQHDALVKISLAGMVARLNLLRKSLDKWA
jgi:hypothetical protein